MTKINWNSVDIARRLKSGSPLRGCRCSRRCPPRNQGCVSGGTTGIQSSLAGTCGFLSRYRRVEGASSALVGVLPRNGRCQGESTSFPVARESLYTHPSFTPQSFTPIKTPPKTTPHPYPHQFPLLPHPFSPDTTPSSTDIHSHASQRNSSWPSMNTFP